jgi:PKD repeat protein
MKKIFLNKPTMLVLVSALFAFSANAQNMQNRQDNRPGQNHPTATSTNWHPPVNNNTGHNNNDWRNNNNNNNRDNDRNHSNNNNWHPPVIINNNNHDRDHDNDRYRNNPIVRGSFRAYPTIGRSPLYVLFTNSYQRQSGTLTLDFGDGRNETLRPNDRTTHLYRRPGVYTARVVQGFCPPGARCFAPERVIDTATIRVTR